MEIPKSHPSPESMYLQALCRLFGTNGNLEMMAEVVKEAAQRSLVDLPSIKLTIAIQNWGAPDTFEVDGNYLEELNKVAEAIGAKGSTPEKYSRFNWALPKERLHPLKQALWGTLFSD